MWKIYNKLLKIFTLGFVGVLSIACLTACGESRTPEKANEPLSAPSGLKADFWEFSWQEVENATGYVVSVLEEEYQTTETSFELFEYLAPNDLVTLQVKAKGNGVETLDSEWSEVEYEAEPVTKNLNYNLLPDGTYEVYCKEGEVPKNGELVLPDTYLGRDVTVFSPREKSLFEPDFPEYGGVVAVRLPARVKKITDGALYRSQIEKIYIPKTAESVDGFTGCKKLTKLLLPENVKEIGGCGGSGLKEIILPEGLERIGQATFASCVDLKEISLPSGLKKINLQAFANSGIEEIEIPEGVTEIKEKTFMNTHIKRAVMKGVTKIGHSAFENASELTEVIIAKDMEEIESNAFKGTALTRISLLGEIEIGESAFENTSLTEIIFSDKIKYIEKNAFAGTPWFSRQQDGLVTCGNALYKYKGEMPSNTVINDIPSHVDLIAESAFENCVNLKEILLAEGITLIGANAFNGCTGLEKVVLPQSLENIGMDSFSGCSNLKNLDLPTGLKNTTWNSDGTGVEYFEIPESITSFSRSRAFLASALTDSPNLKGVVVHKGIAKLGYNAFIGSDKLDSFFYLGTENEWQSVAIDTNLSSSVVTSDDEAKRAEREWIDAFAEKVTVYYYSESEPTGEGNFWRYVDGVPTVWGE